MDSYEATDTTLTLESRSKLKVSFVVDHYTCWTSDAHLIRSAGATDMDSNMDLSSPLGHMTLS